MKYQTVPLLFALLATGSLAMADPVEGTREVTLSGAGGSDKDFDNNSLNLDGTYGYYRSTEVLLGIRQSAGASKVDGENANWTGATRGFVDYHFKMDNVRPYVGASLGYLYGDDVEDTFIAGPEIGLKAYVAPDTFVAFNIEYQFLFESAEDADSQIDDGALAYSLGLGFNF
jgi:hypothetical protein